MTKTSINGDYKIVQFALFDVKKKLCMTKLIQNIIDDLKPSDKSA